MKRFLGVMRLQHDDPSLAPRPTQSTSLGRQQENFGERHWARAAFRDRHGPEQFGLFQIPTSDCQSLRRGTLPGLKQGTANPPFIIVTP